MPKANAKAFIVYEESMPLVQLVDFLTINHYAAVISPLHDKDVYTAEDVKRWRESQELLYGDYIPEGATEYQHKTGEVKDGGYGQVIAVTETRHVPQVGELKKPHRHVYIKLDYSAQLTTWLSLLAPINIHYVEEIHSTRAYLRYLAHLDSPEKAEYDRNEVIQLGGVDISCLFEKTQRDADNLEVRILNAIGENMLDSITKLQRYLLYKTKDMEAYREVKAHYGYWSQYMRNMYFVTEVNYVGEDGKPNLLMVDPNGVVIEKEDRKGDKDAA